MCPLAPDAVKQLKKMAQRLGVAGTGVFAAG